MGGNVLSSRFIGTKFILGFAVSLERDPGCMSAPKGQGEGCPVLIHEGTKAAVLLDGGSLWFYHS